MAGKTNFSLMARKTSFGSQYTLRRDFNLLLVLRNWIPRYQLTLSLTGLRRRFA
ncbi:MAG: hypothetical protein HON43_08050 [Alphaproteobacteria bacterium]|nr:hypothetical protein [Alphaproteobacteria bacterium]MBT5389127.1 hypothetical protein [Alphaproteobacteria bacterium]